MELDEDGSHKKAKLLEGGEIVNEEIFDGFKKVVLVPMKVVHVNQFSFNNVEGGTDSLESIPVFKSKEELKASYMEKRKQSLEEIRNLLP